MKPEWDLLEIVGIVVKENENLAAVERYIAKGNDLATSKAKGNDAQRFIASLAGYLDMVKIPNRNFEMLKTEVTQKLYQAVMGENPSKFYGENNPVEMVSWYDTIYFHNKLENNPMEIVSWYDTIYFCNKLSEMLGYEPVYAADGNTDVTEWGYTPLKGKSISRIITQNESANGFRLPTKTEWEYAARGGQNYKYAGSDNLDEAGWYRDNSGDTMHPVAQKKPNGYGLYDMSGNVSEWLWDEWYGDSYLCGGSWHDNANLCEIGEWSGGSAYIQRNWIGFRIVRTVK